MQPITPTPSPLTVIPGANGHNVLLTAEEAPLYQLHVTRFFTDYLPVTQTECELVGRLALTEWRLNRLARIEMGLFAAAHLEFNHLFADHDPNVRDLLIENHAAQVYSRQLKDLSLQESQLRRYFTTDEKRYLALQKTRLDQAEAEPSSPDISAPDVAVTTATAHSAALRITEFSEALDSIASSSSAFTASRNRDFTVSSSKHKNGTT